MNVNNGMSNGGSATIQLKMKPKYYQCCVPGCPTYDSVSNFLRFPMDSSWREQWLKAVPMRNWVIGHDTLLCLKHFLPHEVALYTRINSENGEVKILKNHTPLVKEGAVPSLFDLADPLKPETEYWPDIMFEIPFRDYHPQTFGDLEAIRDGTDFLIDFYYLLASYGQKLKDNLRVWKVKHSAQALIFYLMDFKGIPKMSTSVRITSSLVVSVILEGRIMDPVDLTWILPVTGRISRWSQLQLLLQHFESGVK